MERAYTLFSEEKFEECIVIFEQHIAINKEDIKAIYHLSLSYRRLNDHIKSLQLLEQCLEIAPEDVDIIAERGVGKFHLNDKRGALQDMDLCVELEPENPYRYSCRAYIKGNLNDNEGAYEDYQKAIELDPEDVIALNNLGLIEEKLGKIEASKNRFKGVDDILGSELFDRPEEIKKLLAESRPISQEEFEKLNKFEPTITEPEKLSFKSYLETIKYVFGSKKGRQEFFGFLKGTNKKED